MVSSTCYDLKQVRKDLNRFIEEMGYNPLLSEFDYFPIDPDLDTVENCRRRVEQDADIMVLIIGGRYGYVDPESDKSITNLEYLTARAKGIPVYAFVDKGILPLLPMWERNPNADFGDTVPNTKVFEFIKQVRGKDSVWTIEFEHAQDIVQALKHQLAYQMLEGLNLRKQIRAHQSEIPADISGKAMRLILEKPINWKYSFYGQVLADEVKKHADMYQEYRLGLIFSRGEIVTHDTFLRWLQGKLSEASRLGYAMEELMGKHLVTAFGPEGIDPNLDDLAFVARRTSVVYKEALVWSLQVRQVQIEDYLQPVIDRLGNGLSNLIRLVNEYAHELEGKTYKSTLQPRGPEAGTTAADGDILGTEFAELVKQCFRNRKSAQ